MCKLLINRSSGTKTHESSHEILRYYFAFAATSYLLKLLSMVLDMSASASVENGSECGGPRSNGEQHPHTSTTTLIVGICEVCLVIMTLMNYKNRLQLLMNQSSASETHQMRL